MRVLVHIVWQCDWRFFGRAQRINSAPAPPVHLSRFGENAPPCSMWVGRLLSVDPATRRNRRYGAVWPICGHPVIAAAPSF